MKKAALILVSILALSMMFMMVAPVFAARRGTTYSIIVLESGNPKVGLWVRFYASNNDGSAVAPAWTQTNSEGKASVNVGNYRYSSLTVGYLSTLPTSDPTVLVSYDMVLYDGRATSKTIKVTFPGTALG